MKTTTTSCVWACAVAFAGMGLGACGDDGGTTSGSGGGGGSDTTATTSGSGQTTSGPTTSAVTSGGATTAATTGATTTATTTATTSGPVTSSVTTGQGGEGGSGQGGQGVGGNFTECDDPIDIFVDEDLNACGNAFCCDEFTLCAGDFELCFDLVEGTIDTDLAGGADLVECLTDAGCLEGSFEVCDSGLAFNREAQDLAECLGDNCCAEFSACTSDGTDVQGCIDCLNGEQADFDLCNPANDCALASCDTGLIFIPICDSGLGVPDVEIGTCLDDNCCTEFSDCTGDQSDEDITACIDCFNTEGGGPLCDDAIACEALNCNTEVCDSGISVGDIDLAACLTESCCAAYTTCVGSGSDDDIQLCIDCFIDEGGALCDGAIACGDANCGGAGGGGGVGGGG